MFFSLFFFIFICLFTFLLIVFYDLYKMYVKTLFVLVVPSFSLWFMRAWTTSDASHEPLPKIDCSLKLWNFALTTSHLELRLLFWVIYSTHAGKCRLIKCQMPLKHTIVIVALKDKADTSVTVETIINISNRTLQWMWCLEMCWLTSFAVKKKLT